MDVIKVLGSCSGTEPMPDRHHTSLVLTVNDRSYFFDAGENCSYAAHLGGIDLLKTRAVFVSHTHYDHIGGLMGLFWTIRKLCWVKNSFVADNKIQLYIPLIEAWENIYGALKYTEGNFKTSFQIVANAPKLGRFYHDENIDVSAYESHHLPAMEHGRLSAVSYRVDLGRKSFVFSGDIQDMEDLLQTVGNGCDILLCETGHHKVADVCKFAQKHNVKKLIFVHHGREILDEHATVKAALDACEIPVELAFDGMEIEIGE